MNGNYIEIVNKCQYSPETAKQILTNNWNNIISEEEDFDIPGSLSIPDFNSTKLITSDKLTPVNGVLPSIHDYLYISCTGLLYRLTALHVEEPKKLAVIAIRYPSEDGSIILRIKTQLKYFMRSEPGYPGYDRAKAFLIDTAIRNAVAKHIRDRLKDANNELLVALKFISDDYQESLLMSPVANEYVFANFIHDIIDNPYLRDDLIFCEDEDMIYLHYKKYWKVFCEYCVAHHIEVKTSAAEFRRKNLDPIALIKPQYQPRHGEYTRYDYRKVNEQGIEKSVLAVSKNACNDILDFEFTRDSRNRADRVVRRIEDIYAMMPAIYMKRPNATNNQQ